MTVLFVGTIAPHLVFGHRDPHDRFFVTWLLVATLFALLTAFGLSVVLARRLSEPMDDWVAAARRFAAGDHSVRPAEPGPPELRDLTAALDAAAESIERSERERHRLASDIAHELRTPLTVLQASLEELRDGLVPPDRATLAGLHDQARRMGRVIDDLSVLAETEGSQLGLHLRPVDLGQTAHTAVAASAGVLHATGLRVDLDLRPAVVVVADSDRIHQMLTNLLTNAAQYCRPGDHVTVRVDRDGSHGLLQVTDTGPGICAASLPHVFDRAWRGPAATVPGSGLGLPIVRALAEAHGGTATLDSTEGVGTTISIRLPGLPSVANPTSVAGESRGQRAGR